MKAIVCERYGPPEVLKIREVEKPTAKDNEILIKVRATTVNSGDTRIRAVRVPLGFGLLVRLGMGFSGPRQPILGFELAGEVEAVGKDVTRFKPGDKVFGSAGFAFGCYAEYRALPESGALAPVPENLTDAEAASLCFGGTTALYYLRRGKLQRGEKLLINGASGAVGTAAIQIAKHLGAEVTAVCSTANLELVKSLGADRVVDYTKADFTVNGETYDVIMDNVGNAPFSRVRKSLKNGGRFLMVIGNLPEQIQANFQKQVVSAAAKGEDLVNAETISRIADLGRSRALKPVIDRTYPFEEIVEAHRYVDTGRKRGSVVITLPQGS